MSTSATFICAVFLIIFVAVEQTYATIDFKTLDHLKPSVSNETQAQAVKGLIQRLLPARASQFHVVVDKSIGPPNLDTFEVETTGSNEVTFTGTTGVAAASAFYHYLSTYCHCHVSWSGDQLDVPSQLPVVKPKIQVTSPNRFRYYQNVCTVSYSFVWWDWSRWEREIDWMAMNGINLPLAFNGQEAIWQRVYLQMGLTQQELDQFFGGPAFLAWARMGNLRGWGGPLPQSWHDYQLQLQHKILKRMREFGIIPVLPAFGGFVPGAFTRLYPEAHVTRLGAWGHFNKTYCCSYLLSPLDPLFTNISKTFLSEYIKEFGTDHIYNTDTFNEMSPPSKDPEYLAAASKAVHDGMLGADKDAVWLMQGWLFQNGFWGTTEIKSYVLGVPLGKMIVLDLFAEVRPVYQKANSFFGQPFIWCMLHNFGGNLGMYGAIDSVNKGPEEGRAFPNSSMVGTGLTPEGINQNYVMYDFMNKMGWRNQSVPDLQIWFKNYSHGRYGSSSHGSERAWDILKGSVYNSTDGHKDHCKGIVIKKPSLKLDPSLWYDWKDVVEAWGNFLNATKEKVSLQNSETFRYDLIDVTRQVLQDCAYCAFYKKLLKHWSDRDAEGVRQEGDNLLQLIDDMDLILSSNEHYLLGKWIKSAQALATNQTEMDLYEYNAKNQITLWGPDGNILDYGNKMWGGLMKSYYKSRWQLFVDSLYNSTVEHRKFNQDAFNNAVFKIESAWTFDKTVYPVVPKGDPVGISQQLFQKYKPIIDKVTEDCRSGHSVRSEDKPSGLSGEDFMTRS
ncbi:alpha-N-acetylglucosaminidase-like isoform X2 [Ptychodera flava]|uniref:alpha-N-acetylglucosaminidase-like isoform X2 n=1 Tax=Ptychodera flava TaxID=63121 RepID=UPI00396A2AA6